MIPGVACRDVKFSTPINLSTNHIQSKRRQGKVGDRRWVRCWKEREKEGGGGEGGEREREWEREG